MICTSFAAATATLLKHIKYLFAARLCCLVWKSGPERLPLGQYIGPSTVRRIWKLCIGRQKYIPAVALVTGTLQVLLQGSIHLWMVSRLHDFWATNCNLAMIIDSAFVTCSAVHEYNKTPYYFYRLVTNNMIYCVLVRHMFQ